MERPRRAAEDPWRDHPVLLAILITEGFVIFLIICVIFSFKMGWLDG